MDVVVLDGPPVVERTILVVNAGSSSLKLRVLEPDDRIARSVDLPVDQGQDRADAALAEAIDGFGPIEAVGHRIVHGGTRFTTPVRVDPEVTRALVALTDLAPLHQPKSLAALAAVGQLLPDVPAVACFDTAFHASMPAGAATYGLPREWRIRWPLRRFGFHGLSHAYASRRAAELVGRDPTELRIVSCHLGAGASLAAVDRGRSVDTTMGFTPLDGLIMATRSGAIDPGLVLWLEEHVGMPPAELAATLEQRSGLLGLAGTADMRTVIERALDNEPEAALALDVYVHRLRSGIGAMAAAMGGLDVLVFTGGVGEHAPEVRRRASVGLAFLGIELDPTLDDASADALIGRVEAPVKTLVVTAREDLQIAHEVRAVLGW